MPPLRPLPVVSRSGSRPSWLKYHIVPVRPSPVCTSSSTKHAPRSRQMRSTRRQVAGLGSGMPRVAGIGSRITAAVAVVDRPVERGEVVERNLHEPRKVGAERDPDTRGRPPRARARCGRGSRPPPRPRRRRPVRARATLIARSFASPPPTPNTTPGSSPPVEAARRSASGRAPPGHEMVVADVEVIERVAHRADHAGMTVAEVEHAAVAVAVEQPAAVERVTET